MMANLFQRLRKRRPELETEIDAELSHHLEMKQRQLEEQGIGPEEARRAARRSLGNMTVVKNDTREVWRFSYLESLWSDLAYSVRLLRKDRVFTLVALLTLTIGIGANAAIFSLLNGLLWRPLPVDHPEQLVRLTVTNLPPQLPAVGERPRGQTGRAPAGHVRDV